MLRKKLNRNSRKLTKVLYSIRVDGELDALIKKTLENINCSNPGVTLTEMVNAIFYDVFFDVRKHNTPRDYEELLGRMDDAVTILPLTRKMVDVFFSDNDQGQTGVTLGKVE